MTYGQLLEALEEARERQNALDRHLEQRPRAERGPRPYRTRVDPAAEVLDQWEAKKHTLEAALDEEIT